MVNIPEMSVPPKSFVPFMALATLPAPLDTPLGELEAAKGPISLHQPRLHTLWCSALVVGFPRLWHCSEEFLQLHLILELLPKQLLEI